MSASDSEMEGVLEFEEKRESQTERIVSTGSTEGLRRRRPKKQHDLDDEDDRLDAISESKRKSVSKSRLSGESLEDRVARTWFVFLSIPIALLILSDLAFSGIHGKMSSFVGWWDVLGTVTFYRSRSHIFNLRDMPNETKTYLWAAYVLFLEYMLYAGGGLISKSFLRGTILLPSVAGMLDFTIQGFIPGHFSPYDYLSKLTADFSTIYTRRLGLLVSFAWSISKIKSFRPFVEEIEYVHGLDVASALLLCIASCEVGSVINKVEMNFFEHREEMLRRVPGGIWKTITSTGFKASIAGSIFMYMAVKLDDVYVADLVFSYLSFFAMFYKYSSGLVEQVYAENIGTSRALGDKARKLLSRTASTRDWVDEMNVARNYMSAFRGDVNDAFAYSSQIWSKDLTEFAHKTITVAQEKQAEVVERVSAIDLKSVSHGLRWTGTDKWKWNWGW